MKQFVYVCADSGIPLPGNKGASLHVEAVTREFVAQGLNGQVLSPRCKAGHLADVELVDISLSYPKTTQENSEKETLQFLNNCQSLKNFVNHKPDFVYERYSLWSVSGLALARQQGCPFIIEVNSPLPIEAQQYRSLKQPALANATADFLLQEADGIVCVSEEIANWVSNKRGHSNEVWTIPNGFNADLFKPISQQSPRPAGCERDSIVFCGTFRPWHGLEHLFQAFDLLIKKYQCSADLILIGDGPERDTLEDWAAKNGLSDYVRFMGKMPHSEVAKHAQKATLAIAPYPKLDDFYFSPLKIYEYMGLGLPVVASSIGQIPEILAKDRGVLCEPENPERLAEGCAQLLQSPEKQLIIGKAASDWAHENASWQVRAREILERIGSLQ